MKPRLCQQCGLEIPSGKQGGFCSDECKLVFFQERPRQQYQPRHIGAASELIAAGDLSMLGWEVFLPASFHSACDLVAIKGSRVVRVEVKTGHKKDDGGLLYNFPTGSNQFDVIAVVLDDRSVVYIPAL